VAFSSRAFGDVGSSSRGRGILSKPRTDQIPPLTRFTDVDLFAARGDARPP
jgi:hypothetical protein